MYTQCPKCRTIFAIDEDALQASLGIVRCGRCAERFDALQTLSDRLPADPAAALPVHAADALAPTLTESIATDRAPIDQHADDTDLPPAADSAATQDAAAAATAEPWLATLSGERTQALIADAAGIPADAIHGDAAWQVLELPVQSGDLELDAIPLVPAADAAPANDAADREPVQFVESVASERFSGPWTVDIPTAGMPMAGHVASGFDPAAAASTKTADDDTSAEASPPPPATQLLATEDPADVPRIVDATATTEPEAATALTAADIATDALPAADDMPLDSAPPESAEPVYIPPRQGRVRRSEWLWASGCLLLALGLAAQVAWANRVALVLDPATQALALRTCKHLSCHLPRIRDTAKLELLSRDVRPDPQVAHALSITATFRNNAPFRQPWPVVVVRLTDLDNGTVAMRRFRPADYLPDPRRRAAGIPAGTTAAVAFAVADPGSRAVSFNFGFE